MRARNFCIAIAFALIAAPVSAQFDTRFGMPVGTDLAKLLKEPQVIKYEMKRYRDSAYGEDRIAGLSDSHAVIDAPFEAVVYYLGTPEEAKKLSSRLFVNRVESRNGDKYVVYQEIGIDFLGSRVGYKIRFEYEKVTFADGAAGGRTRMLESLDKNLFEAYTSWYAMPVVIGGKSYTYVRMYSRNGLRNPMWGLEAIAGIFAPGEVKDNYRVLAEVARKRL